GKYLAVAAVYSIALLFSMTQLIALWVIGQPDWGVVFSTYIGYWLAGLALLAIGMFASSLTSSVPVAFVLAALFCSIPVFAGKFFLNLPKLIEQILPESLSSISNGFFAMEQFGIDWNLQDFTLGLIPLANVVYFVSIIAFTLYLNLVVISRRHWSRGQQVSLASQFAVRIVSLAIALICFNFVVNQASSSLLTRLDLTSDGLYTLDESTIETLEKAKEEKRPVTIQAFVSRTIPRSYVNTKKQFTGLLRQFQYYGGNYVDVRFVDVLPNSNEETQAKRLGIEPRPDRSEVGGRIVEQDVYLGAFVQSTQDDAVLPFVENDSSIEYQLTHSIATTTDKSRKITLGILDSDTFFAGPEIEGRRVPWAYNQTYSYLKTQYKIKNIAQGELSDYVDNPDSAEEADSPDIDKSNVKEAPDVLLVADPSSLDNSTVDSLLLYMESGNPVVFLADPIPFFWTSRNPVQIGILNAPKQERVSPQSPYAQVLSSTFAPKADEGKCTRILEALGVEWNNGEVAWNILDPHPNFKGAWIDQTGQSTWPEYFGLYECAFVFVKNSGGYEAFNPYSTISSGLKETLFFYPGSVRKSSDSDTEFTALINLGTNSG
ncbi:MAG: Gldg family protein, partial [Planctomycetota bacterium]